MSRIDGRDLWSGRVTHRLEADPKICRPISSGSISPKTTTACAAAKQLCKTDRRSRDRSMACRCRCRAACDICGDSISADYLSQGCLPTSLYSPECVSGAERLFAALCRGRHIWRRRSTPASIPMPARHSRTNLRVIESTIDPTYKAKNDMVEFNADYAVTPALTFTSQTGFNQDFLWSTRRLQSFQHVAGHFRRICDPERPRGLSGGSNFRRTAFFAIRNWAAANRLVPKICRTNMPGS